MKKIAKQLLGRVVVKLMVYINPNNDPKYNRAIWKYVIEKAARRAYKEAAK